MKQLCSFECAVKFRHFHSHIQRRKHNKPSPNLQGVLRQFSWCLLLILDVEFCPCQIFHRSHSVWAHVQTRVDWRYWSCQTDYFARGKFRNLWIQLVTLVEHLFSMPRVLVDLRYLTLSHSCILEPTDPACKAHMSSTHVNLCMYVYIYIFKGCLPPLPPTPENNIGIERRWFSRSLR